MMEETVNRWPQADLDHAAGELAREYGNLALSVIVLVVNSAKKRVKPEEGRVKLLQEARRRIGQ